MGGQCGPGRVSGTYVEHRKQLLFLLLVLGKKVMKIRDNSQFSRVHKMVSSSYQVIDK
jgi:hypothetical protein